MEAEGKLSWLGGACAMTPRDARNSRRFAAWAAVYMAAFVAATLALKAGWLPPGLASYAVALAPGIFGVFAIHAFIRYLHEADELERRIQLEGLALGFGGGLMFMIGWRLLERAGLPRLDISDPIMVMVVFWVIGQLLGRRRFS